MLPWLAIAFGIGCALSVFVRTGRAWPRAVNVLAMLVVAAAAIAPPRAERATEPARVEVVTTGEPSPELRARLDALREQAEEPKPTVALSAAGRDVHAALATAALRAGPRRSETIAVWNAPFAPSAQAPSAPFAGAWAATEAPLPFSPEALALAFSSAPRAGRPFAAELRLDDAGAPLPFDVSMRGEGWSAESRVEAGGASRGEAVAEPTAEGPASVEVATSIDGRRVRWSGTFEVAKPPRVLVVSAPSPLAAALRAQGVRVEEAGALPSDLGAYAAVVLSLALPVDVQRRLQSAVDDGLGLFVVGDGFQRDGEPLRDLLPVRMLPQPDPATPGDGPGGNPDAPSDAQPEPPPSQPQPKQDDIRAEDPVVQPGAPTEVDKHAIAMVLVVDRSGSMGMRVRGGDTKMSYAKTSARETARALGEGDEVGLVTFGDDEQARIELPLTDAVDFARVEQGIAKLGHSNERTFLDSGLVTARKMLSASKAAVRHVVVLSDGEVWDQELVLRQRANAMKKEGLTLSMISIVDDRTQVTFQAMAERLARDGGGAFLPVRDARSVPKLVSAEVVRALDRVGRKPRGDGQPSPDQPAPDRPPEPPKQPDPPKPPEPKPDPAPKDASLSVRAVARSPVLAPEPAVWPTLKSAFATAARASAHVLLVAGDAGTPALAFGNLGLGRVGVFAADLAGDAGAAFRGDAEFPARFAQWVASVQRAEPSRKEAAFLAATVEPPAPLPREVAFLRAATGASASTLDGLRLPPPLVTVEHEPQTPDWAFAAISALLLLAVCEWFAVRRAG